MQKLIIPLLFSFVLFFFSGCQTETPVSPADQDISFDKGKPLNFTGIIWEETNGILSMDLEWAGLKDIYCYKVSYYHLLTGKNLVATIYPSNLTFRAPEVMLPNPGATCEITVQAIKLKKGVETVVASGTRTFTWTGDPIPNITFSSSSYLITNTSNPALVDYYIDFNDVPGESYYTFIIYPSWSTSYYNFTRFDSYLGPMSLPRTGQSGDFLAVTVWAYDINNNILAIGTTSILYTP